MISITGQWQTIRENATMLVPSAVLTALLEYSGGEAEAFITWFLLSCLDCVLGIAIAVSHKTFCTHKLYHWVGRVFFQLLSIFLFAGVLSVLKIAANVDIMVANWLLFFYAFIDFSAVMDKIILLGFLPKPVYALVSCIRRRAVRVFSTALNDEKLGAELNAALKAERKDNTT